MELSVGKAARRCGVAPSTIYRWATKGVRIARGQVVLLKSKSYGTRLRFEPSAIDEFLQACKEARDVAGTRKPVRMNPLIHSHEEAARRLEAAGI